MKGEPDQKHPARPSRPAKQEDAGHHRDYSHKHDGDGPTVEWIFQKVIGRTQSPHDDKQPAQKCDLKGTIRGVEILHRILLGTDSANILAKTVFEDNFWETHSRSSSSTWRSDVAFLSTAVNLKIYLTQQGPIGERFMRQLLVAFARRFLAARSPRRL